ncbi:hypothetical protein KUV57_11315 [Epibacterium sp. DP7N7-1]|nr:hypothetical protein [Epibacterium sp. DP7N7-1]
MKLMDAVEGVQALYNMAGIDGHFELMALQTTDDFWANNWEGLEESYDTPEKISALQIDGQFPEASDESLKGFPDGDLNFGMSRTLRMAFEVAREEPEVLVEDRAINSLEAVNMLAAFWTAYGPEICENTKTYDLSEADDSPGM